MNADWVAASVRARSIAQRRVGAGKSRSIAAQPTLTDGLALLSGTVYAERTDQCTSQAATEWAISDTVLWQLRVLAGWIPGTGTRLVRAAAGAFERDNILALSRSLDDGHSPPESFALGSLALAWPRLRAARTTQELTEALRRSPWGEVGSGDATALRDILTLVWLRRLTRVAPAARPWAESTCALTVARILLVDHSAPPPRLVALIRPLLGRTWETAESLPALQAALPKSVRTVFDDIRDPEDLWRAEARQRAQVETTGFRLLRSSLPGPDVVLGSIVVLAMDAWRVRAALSSVGTSSSEVLDAVV